MVTYIMVDVETDGPIPGDYSMTSLGAVIIDEELNKRFYTDIKQLGKSHDPSRDEFVKKSDIEPKEAMLSFKKWIKENTEGKLIFISDNNGFDWMFVCYYFWHYLGENPLGYTSMNLQSFYKGIKKNLSSKIEEVRREKLTHNALMDALDNAVAFKEILRNDRLL